ncbi:hypothetical protein SAMD00019534_101570, partial [Acytostelium subglobosum LB1]|uniref:hypothetical protein n=1 Tax=Acytostelium subglobosum LB1 TaxID=1410327 RepID=UPI000644BBE6
NDETSMALRLRGEDQPLSKVEFPSALNTLDIKFSDQHLIDGSLPNTITKLTIEFDNGFIPRIGIIPDSVVDLRITRISKDHQSQGFPSGLIPTSVKQLHLSGYLALSPGCIPNSVACLLIDLNSQSNLSIDTIPNTMTSLFLSNRVVTNIDFSGFRSLKYMSIDNINSIPKLPTSLSSLFMEKFNNIIVSGSLPNNLIKLHMNRLNIRLHYGSLPNSIQELFLQQYNHPMKVGDLPSSLTHLEMMAYNHDLDLSNVPLVHLSLDNMERRLTLPTTLVTLIHPNFYPYNTNIPPCLFKLVFGGKFINKHPMPMPPSTTSY